VGGLGFACSGNIGDEVAVFEPTHGSAPKYEKLDPPIVNPIAMILSAAMLLDHVGETEKAEAVRAAVADVVAVRPRPHLRHDALTGRAQGHRAGRGHDAADDGRHPGRAEDGRGGGSGRSVVAGRSDAAGPSGHGEAGPHGRGRPVRPPRDGGGGGDGHRAGRASPGSQRCTGTDIRATVERTLLTLGVERARSRWTTGAVPWVIAARVEAAARAAGLRHWAPRRRRGPGRRWRDPRRRARRTDRLRRSRLYLPGNEPKFMLNAGLHGPTP
jgi:hypothetical protein